MEDIEKRAIKNGLYDMLTERKWAILINTSDTQ